MTYRVFLVRSLIIEETERQQLQKAVDIFISGCQEIIVTLHFNSRNGILTSAY